MRFECRYCRVKYQGLFRSVCPACSSDFALVPEGYRRPAKEAAKVVSAVSASDGIFGKIEDTKPLEGPRASTGFPALDAVFGKNENGKYAGQTGVYCQGVTVFSGVKGLGKTALLYEILAQFLRDGVRCAFVSAEQEANAIRAAIVRLGLDNELRKMNVLCTKDFRVMMDKVEKANLDFVILDSVNKIYDPLDPTRDDTKSRVNIMNRLLDDAWRGKRPRAWICVSQMTSDQKVAGREELLHDVDVIALLRRGPYGDEIVVDCPDKNRFARAGKKIARFRMNDEGKMVAIADPPPPPPVESGALVPAPEPTTVVAPAVDIAVTIAAPLVAPEPDEFDLPQLPITDKAFEGLLARSKRRAS